MLRRRFQNNSQVRRSRRHRARGSGQARYDCHIWTWPDACGAQWRGRGLRPHCPAWIRAKRYMMLMAWRCQPEWRGHRWSPQMLTQSLHVDVSRPPPSPPRPALLQTAPRPLHMPTFPCPNRWSKNIKGCATAAGGGRRFTHSGRSLLTIFVIFSISVTQKHLIWRTKSMFNGERRKTTSPRRDLI